MRIKGEEVKKEEAIYGPEIIQRGEKLFAFYAQPVWATDEFEELCPEPTPPVNAWGKDGKKTYNHKDPQYKQDCDTHDKRYHGWFILKSLEPTELDLSEDGISLDQAEGLERVHEVLRKHLGHVEWARLMRFVDAANSLDSAKIEENLATFFLQAAQQEAGSQQSDQSGDPASSNSGELASDGE